MNGEKLEKAIEERGYKIEDIATLINIPKKAVVNKISGAEEFTVSETVKLLSILNLTCLEVQEIFFGQ